jgi:hypothetical protein
MVYTSGLAKNRLGKHRFGSLFDADISAQTAALDGHVSPSCAAAKTGPVYLTQRDVSLRPSPL